MSSVLDKFLQYVAIDTRSDEESKTTPSTMKQHDLAKLLKDQMMAYGVQDVVYDKEHCYLYGKIPASKGKEALPSLGFISHMDTSPEVTGTNVVPRIVSDYDGGDIILNEDKKIVMTVADFPQLVGLKGKNLVVTDGTTLLGADDKAGIAEIMTMAEYFHENPEAPHGPICIAFTPDEEIGCGTDHFDLKQFGAEYAYTVDGGPIGELEYENFNAASAKVKILGRNVHPGAAKGKMINSMLIAAELLSLLPKEQNPMYTEKYEGFYHLIRQNGCVEETEMEFIIRDHDRALFEQKKDLFRQIVAFLNTKYGQDLVSVELEDSYYNMKEIMVQHMHLVENAAAAMKEVGIEPLISPIRGGTDGARLSFMGLPCPNLCTGGNNYHSRFEYACVDEMELVGKMLIKICELYAK